METLSFYLLTWNVVTLQPPSGEYLQRLLQTQADFIAVGLQEVASQPQDIVVDSIYEDSWTNSWRDVLSQHNYVKVHTIRLVGIILSLFAKRNHLTGVRNIEASYTRVGLGGYWGNKGAVSIRFNYKGSSVCLINSHLTPHENKREARNADYLSIVSQQKFKKEKATSILDHDFIFWIGDLNYRLKPNFYNPERVAKMVSENELKPLLEADELQYAISNNEAFNGFSECKINFHPTYKFLPNSQNYDLKRKPAWTDRVLYRYINDSDVQISQSFVKCKSYDSHPYLIISDHKPVSASFDIKIKGGTLPVVKFDPIPSWLPGETKKIVYRFPSSLQHSVWQWIAIFRVGFSSYGEYITYVWNARDEKVAGSGIYEVTIPENSLRVPGQYQAAFMSEEQPYHILGISHPFEVQG